MTTEPASEQRSKGLLWAVVLLVLAAAGLFWGASAVLWIAPRQGAPFGTGVTGEDVRPELVPVALASLAAVAAVLATGGWLRRVVGVLVAVAGGLMTWRAFQPFDVGWFAYADNVPPNSTPEDLVSLPPGGPLMMTAGGLLLFVAGVLVVLRAGRMPAMGAKYSAPGAAKQKTRDPDRQMWNDLDAGHDPTDDQDR